MQDIILLLNSISNKNLSPATKNNIMRHLNGMLNFARDEHLLDVNPMIYIKPNFKSNSKRRSLTNEEISLIMNYAWSYENKFALMLETILFTGIRVGELCGIRWNDFSGDFMSLRIDESITDHRFETSTKTETSERDRFLCRRILPVSLQTMRKKPVIR